MFAYRPNDATRPHRDSEGLMGGRLAQCLPDHSGQRELCVVQWSKYNPVVTESRYRDTILGFFFCLFLTSVTDDTSKRSMVLF